MIIGIDYIAYRLSGLSIQESKPTELIDGIDYKIFTSSWKSTTKLIRLVDKSSGKWARIAYSPKGWKLSKFNDINGYRDERKLKEYWSHNDIWTEEVSSKDFEYLPTKEEAIEAAIEYVCR